MPTSRPLDADAQVQARRELARALAAAQPQPLAAWLDRWGMDETDLAWLEQQSLAVFGFYRLQQADLLGRLPAGLADRWREIYRETKMAMEFMNWEVERILAALAQDGVDFLLMKGTALAYGAYPSPACRIQSDLDLWIQPEQVPLAAAVLERHGFLLLSMAERPDALVMLTGGELKLVNRESMVGLIELQWPALRGEWARRTAAVDHAAIWQRRSAVVVGQHRFPTMTPEDALIHLCLHQAINHQFGAPWLRNLLDVHLLAAAQPLDWAQVAARAARWRLATVVWTVLDLAQRLLGTAAPGSFMQALAPSRRRRWLIDRLHLEQSLLTMRTGGYRHQRFLIQTALVDRPRDVVTLLWRSLFPETAWLQARYGAQPGQRLWRLRLLHVWRLATSARV